MLFYDLFAGIGGFRLGMERAGFRCAGSCEIDKKARLVYKKNFGSEPESDDARLISPQRLPDFDVLCAGFPCQPFSVAGRRKGFSDTRNLFYEILKIASQKRPRYLFLENVKGLLSNAGGRTFAKILVWLYEAGYNVEWCVINAKYFVPQSRERVFIIGHNREKCGQKILPLFKGCAFDDITCRAAQEEGKWIRAPYSHALDANYSKGAGSRTMIALLSHTKPNIRERLQVGQNTWTLDTPGMNMALKEGVEFRKFTPLECERLMGFPDGWTDIEGLADTHRYRLLGNAVVPAVVTEIAGRL